MKVHRLWTGLIYLLIGFALPSLPGIHIATTIAAEMPADKNAKNRNSIPATIGRILGVHTNDTPAKPNFITGSKPSTGSLSESMAKILAKDGVTAPTSSARVGKGRLPQAQPLKPWQLFTAADYLELIAYDKAHYVSGLSDAYNWTYAGGFQRMAWFADCTRGRKQKQLAAMFDKWLKQHPERWQEPAAKLFAFALFNFCKNRK